MSFSASILHKLLSLIFTFSFLLVAPIHGLTLDGSLLLSFKYSILSDPLSVLDNWDYTDEIPCLWNGVICAEVESPFGTPDMYRVISLVLPNSQLLGSIPEELGLIPHLRNLDLSNNFLNGTLPTSLFNASELQSLSISNNDISGELSIQGKGLQNLKLLNLSNNAFSGHLPPNLAALQKLNVISLQGNQFSGQIPSGFHYVQVLDLSSNLLNGSLPLAFGGENLKYLNFSSNKLSGFMPPDFAKKIPPNGTIDLSFNNLSGEIPDSMSLSNQRTESFKGNDELCGKPLKKICTVPSTLSIPPNLSTSSIAPAIAAIPQTIDSNPSTSSTNSSQNQAHSRLKPGAIVGIVAGDLAGVGVLAIVSFYVYHLKKKRVDSEKISKQNPTLPPPEDQVQFHKSIEKDSETSIAKASDSPARSITLTTCSCLTITNGEVTSDSTSSDSDENRKADIENQLPNRNQRPLIMVDGETELELETLLKASAYILGSNGATIVYKAVLNNGSSFAVRRIGESGVEKYKDFENEIKVIAKMQHPNLLRIRGFYWGDDEKLVIYDHISNGSLANAGYGKVGLSPYHLPFGTRVKIARGIAAGLAYIHEKKHVHGNIKPSNILLTPEMEPIISDLGLHKLVYGKHSFKSDGATRHFGSRRCSTPLDHQINGSPYVSPAGFMSCTSPYHAPESLNNVKPSPKWDVYSFGVILLELLTGKVFSDRELGQWSSALVQQDRARVLRMADVAIRGDVASREDDMLECFKLGFSCAALASQKRPAMKHALGVLQKIQCS